MYKKFFVFLILFSLFSLGSRAQVINSDRIYDNNIVNVLLYANGNQLSDPVIKLGSDDRLTLSFDDLGNEPENYKYTIVHCTSDWHTSALSPMDYISGYLEGDITNYHFSFNTLTPYIHYQLIFPQPQLRPKLSGNYILKVYNYVNGDTTVLFTKRFFVVEPLVKIEAKVPYYPKKLAYFKIKQQVDFQCFTPDIFSDEPEQRFKVTVQQNGRWDNAYYDLHPTSVTPHSLQFNFANGIVFNSGNEPRYFDMKNYWYRSEFIRKIVEMKHYYNVFLHTDYPRANSQYETYQDNHGKMFITARSDQNPQTEGDYAIVYFYLKMPEFKNAGVYILGQLTNWRFDNKNKMTYNIQTHQYEGKLFLKQGYYEYWYAVLPFGSQQANITPIEGSFWATQNTYTIYVYYHNRNLEYDRLVGIQKIKAH